MGEILWELVNYKKDFVEFGLEIHAIDDWDDYCIFGPCSGAWIWLFKNQLSSKKRLIYTAQTFINICYFDGELMWHKYPNTDSEEKSLGT